MGVADRDYMYESRQVSALPVGSVRPRARRSLRPHVLMFVRVAAWSVIALGVAAVVLLGGSLVVLAILPG